VAVRTREILLPHASSAIERDTRQSSRYLRISSGYTYNVGWARAVGMQSSTCGVGLDLARKLAVLEGKYDRQFRVVFDAIRQLMAPPTTAGRPIGFTADIE
jgi:hypothetical protein